LSRVSFIPVTGHARHAISITSLAFADVFPIIFLPALKAAKPARHAPARCRFEPVVRCYNPVNRCDFRTNKADGKFFERFRGDSLLLIIMFDRDQQNNWTSQMPDNEMSTALENASFETPQVPKFPGYSAKRLLSSGAFGDVWLAEDMCGLFYALKVIYRDNPQIPDGHARELEGLRHYLRVSRENDNLVQIYFVSPGLDDRFFYYAMELADDANSRDRIRVGQYIPRTLAYEIKHYTGFRSVSEVIRLGQSLLRGLSYLHEKHLVHQDLKPSNIIYCGGEPKLADFGLVCVRSKSWIRDSVRTRYYSPERGRGNHSADLFGLGKVLWVYWTGADVADFPCASHEILENAPGAPSNRLNDVISRACEEEPDDRYQAWSEMWQALSEIDPSPSRLSVAAPALPEPEPALSLPSAPVSVINRHSPLYIRRESDARLAAELPNCRKEGGLIRIKGARQSGKTSLIARALADAREAGFEVIMADLRQLNMSALGDLGMFYRALSELISRSIHPEDVDYDSDTFYSANQRLTQFMEDQVFTRLRGPVLLAMDNVEQLIRQSYSPDVYGLIRSWYEARETRGEPWRRFTLMLAYSDDELILEKQMKNESPFNVGIRIDVGGLFLEGIKQLNRAYHSPLVDEQECARFFRLTGGQPFLANLGLYELARRKLDLTEFEAIAHEESGPFRDQLRLMRRRLERIDPNRAGIAAALRGKPCADQEVFLNLQSAGILTGSQREPRFSCEIYSRFLSGMCS
jgi:serine/threonine protein kinase